MIVQKLSSLGRGLRSPSALVCTCILGSFPVVTYTSNINDAILWEFNTFPRSPALRMH